MLEMDYFTRSLRFLLDNFPKSDILYPPNEKGMAFQMKLLHMLTGAVAALDTYENENKMFETSDTIAKKIESLEGSVNKNESADAPSAGEEEKSDSTNEPAEDNAQPTAAVAAAAAAAADKENSGSDANKDDNDMMQDYLPCLLAMCGSGAAYMKVTGVYM